MTRHRWTIEADVDDELLARRRSQAPDEYPLVDDPSEFTWRDLSETIDIGLLDDEPEIVDHEVVT